jgi:checkpoint serine/threonine-protein kinase
LELGDKFLHVEGRGSPDDATALSVQDLDDSEASAGLTLRVLPSGSLWEVHVSALLRQRLSPTAADDFALCSEAFLFSDCVCVLSPRQGLSLAAVLHVYRAKGTAVGEALAAFYAIELLRAVENLHAAGVVHAALQPQCVFLRGGDEGEWTEWAPGAGGIWRSKGLRVGNLSNAIDLQAYPKAASFTADAKDAAGAAWGALLNGQSWTRQPDLLGLADIVHWLVFGEALSVAPSAGGQRAPTKPLPAGWNAKLWGALLATLLNEAAPSLRALRESLEGFLMHNPAKRKEVRTQLCRQSILLLEH